jgi:hypothetical protein
MGTDAEMTATEVAVMQDLGWRINTPTVALFFIFYMREGIEDIALWTTAVFVGFCALLSPELAILDSELVALATTAIAFHVHSKPTPLKKHVHLVRYSVQTVRETMDSILLQVEAVKRDQTSPIFRMFSHPVRDSVALLTFSAPVLE